MHPLVLVGLGVGVGEGLGLGVGLGLGNQVGMHNLAGVQISAQHRPLSDSLSEFSAGVDPSPCLFLSLSLFPFTQLLLQP